MILLAILQLLCNLTSSCYNYDVQLMYLYEHWWTVVHIRDLHYECGYALARVGNPSVFSYNYQLKGGRGGEGRVVGRGEKGGREGGREGREGEVRKKGQ